MYRYGIVRTDWRMADGWRAAEQQKAEEGFACVS